MSSMNRKKYTTLLLAAIGITTLIVSTTPALAFPHALTVITPNNSDPQQEHAKPIFVVLGHTNEPTFGKKSGLHDGKHNVELFLEDEATSLPLKGANLKVDKYYFKDIKTFEKAKSVDGATKIVKNVALRGVFGDPGHYVARQLQDPGIYGYRVYGTIDYFGVAQVPIDTTVFCNSSAGATTKFNSPGWFGGYGCTDAIESIFFP
jgi:hypothetical protein